LPLWPESARLGNSAVLTIGEQANCDPPLKGFLRLAGLNIGPDALQGLDERMQAENAGRAFDCVNRGFGSRLELHDWPAAIPASSTVDMRLTRTLV
jgi:hypothetical protein